MKRKFEGIWIPRDIWLSEALTLQEKIFLVEINSLDNAQGCFANNDYFARFFGLGKTRVSEIINSLVQKGFISSHIDESAGNRRVLKSLLQVSVTPSPAKAKRVLQDSEEGLTGTCKHNNTSNNTENNTLIQEGFDMFWAAYDKKVDRQKCEAKWAKLKQADRDRILVTVETYVAAHPEVKYRKNPLTYLNGACWHDELPTVAKTPKAAKLQTIDDYKSLWQ